MPIADFALKFGLVLKTFNLSRGRFAEGQARALEPFRNRLERGTTMFARPQDNERANVFFRIAAGLEDPSAAEKLR